VKAIIIIVLILVVFGSGAYWSYELFVRPQKALNAEKLLPPEPPPPDPSLPDYERAMAVLKGGNILEARSALEEFIERNPQSTRIKEARDQLGEINTRITLSTTPAPEKEIYVVKSGDVLSRVANRMKTTPELIMRSNNLSGVMLRIGQKLSISPSDFSVVISKKEEMVTLYNRGKFFKQYPIRVIPAHLAAAAQKSGPSPQKINGRIMEKIAWADGTRVTFEDEEYSKAIHWLVNVSGHTLYSAPDETSGIKVNKPPSGLGLAPEAMQELAVLLSRGNPVTIEN
jgi:LysM repeat protein